MVAVVLDLGEELSDSGLSPIAANDRKDVTENVRLCDGAVDVRDDDLVGPLPEVEVAAAARGALVSRRHAELDLVHAGLQVQAALERNRNRMKLAQGCIIAFQHCCRSYHKSL